MIRFPFPIAATIFVCDHKRPDGHPKPCCADRGGRELKDQLKKMVKKRGLKGQLRVMTSSCIGACERGPVALRYPDGELLLGLTPKDLETVLTDSVKND